jgi:hypothetical protein
MSNYDEKVEQTPTSLRSWMKGPYELIKHASGHLKDGDDTDRRLALISFDQAIEVSIDAFINLPHRLRKKNINKDDIKQAQANFHTKIEFLEKYFFEELEDPELPDEIVWCHKLRNEIYHSGNGMSPELHVVMAAQKASVKVFEAVFNQKAQELLDFLPDQAVEGNVFSGKGLTDEMEFLTLYMELDRLAPQLMSVSNIMPKQHGKGWSNLVKAHPALKVHLEELNSISALRNAIVHGKEHGHSKQELVKTTESLKILYNDLTVYLTNQKKNFTVKANLKDRENGLRTQMMHLEEEMLSISENKESIGISESINRISNIEKQINMIQMEIDSVISHREGLNE